MIASVPSSTLLGVDGYPVDVEVQVSNGLPNTTIVGLPDAACREARDRVRSAFVSSGFKWPNQRVTINLAPSDLRKSGTAFDLAIAVGALVASEVIPAELTARMGFLGELGLDGTVRPVDGIVPLADALQCEIVIVPSACINQAALIPQKEVRGVDSLEGLVNALTENGDWCRPDYPSIRSTAPSEPDLSDVRGQPLARWAVEVAAAGGHNLLFVGPPGAGKTMLAKRLTGLLPDLADTDALMTTRVHSAAGQLSRTSPLVTRPPFRSPHHTASKVAISGGGSGNIKPGEVSLAHNGVLFLDEMAEFPRSVLDTLRQPIEEGHVTISRANASVVMPARFLLIGATNPCPCGEGLSRDRCRCTEAARIRYMARLSGPLLDRFDIRINVFPPDPERLFVASDSESSSTVRERVARARERARERNVLGNAFLTSGELVAYTPLTRAGETVLLNRLRRKQLTARGLDRVRRVALTLADLNGQEGPLTEETICAALELRPEVAMQGAS